MNLAVIGCGLIGGSAALAWRRAFPDASVAAFDPDGEALERAFAAGAVTRLAPSASDAAMDADVIIVASPVGAVAEVVHEIAGSVAPGAIVTDTGSVKGPVVARVRSDEVQIPYVGGHPMAGTEHQGFGGARADLFAGAWWILTPDDETSAGLATRLAPPLRALGAKIVEMDPREHDRVVAMVSHLPMLMAAGLVHLAGIPIAGVDARLYAGSGFRDMTRIAESNPQLWLDICLENRVALMEALAALSAEASRIERSLFESDREGLLAFLAGARAARERLPDKADRPELVVLALDVPDRPGTLARVAAVLGDAGVNIEDVRVAHSPSGERGSFFLTVTAAAVSQAINALSADGFVAEVLHR